MGATRKIKKGDRVRDAKWGRGYIGTVTGSAMHDGERWVFVQWDSIAVEDQLLESSVEAIGTRVKGEIETVIKAVEIRRRS